MRRNMKRKWFLNLNILVILLVLGKISSSQECDSNGFSCISCTDYQVCNAGVPQGRIISCKSGNNCADNQLMQCQLKLNCYALNECSQNGIFPNSMSDSDYFVCLSDGGDGFLKYEFTCQDEHFFDESVLSCVPRSVTSSSPVTPSDVENPTSPSTSTDPTSSTDPTASASTDPTAPTSTPTSTSTDPTTPTSKPTSSDPTSSTDPTSSAPTDPTTPTSTPTSTSSDPTSSTPSSTDSTSSTSTSTESTSSTPTSTNPTTPSTSTNPTSPSLPTEPTTPTQTPPFACAGPGIFPSPNNCKMYYRCSTSLKAFSYICPGTSYFNENILKCSLIITPACQEQISKNSTSTVSPSTPPSTTPKPTTTATTTTTPKPTTTTSTTTTSTTIITTPITTTTTSSTPTITSSTMAPFTCPTAGTFENPSDCKTYFRCSTSGKIFRYVCPGNTFFNEFTKRCSLAMTPRCKILTQG